jgi:7,8-dihydropterin-6-yl-methyl-4-(beta-D-ribofuranosyl)aminobenzene 5'-phosphate synthase
MLVPRPVDALEVAVIVDNVSDSLSTNPPGVVSEFRWLAGGGRMKMTAGSSLCCAHHGLSLLLSVNVAGRTETLLFDAGPEDATFRRNARVLGVDFARITDIVLSHGHWDHAGGLPAAVSEIASARGRGNVNCYVHPGMFAQRGTTLPSGLVFPMEPVATPGQLTEAGARVVNTDQAQLLADGAFYLSGEIPRRTPYEVGFPGHMRRTADGQGWEPDPLLMDERFVAVHVRGKGLVVFSACSHAGIVNVLTEATRMFAAQPVHGLFGGLHLSGVTEDIIPQTVADLMRFGPALLAPGHCTGWRALAALAAAAEKSALAPLAVGKRYVIEAA